MQKELEATFLNIDKVLMRKKLTEVGFKCIKPEILMRRKAYDFNSNGKIKKWARVRDEGDKITMTIKEISHTSDINGTYETELVINDFDVGCDFLVHAGLKQKSYQETYREKWLLDDVEVCIDTWPGLDPFVEIEGKSEELVRKYSELLGFNFVDARFGSTDAIYEEVLGIPAEEICWFSEIIFENPPQIRKK